MDKLADMRARVAQLKSEIDAINDKALAEKRAPTPEEEKVLTAKRAEYRPLAGTLREMIEDEKIAQDLEQPADTPETPSGASEARDRIAVGTDRSLAKPFRTLGEQLRAIMRAEDRSNPEVDKRLLRINAELRAASGLSETVPHDGGFAVQTDHAADIIGRIFNEGGGAIASRVRQIPIGANANGFKQTIIDETSRATGSRWGGVRAYWLDEAGTPTASKPKTRQMQMDLEKLGAIWYLTDELMQDSTAMGSVANQAFAEEIQFAVEDAIVNGNGVGKPLGILNSPALVTVTPNAAQTIANSATYIAENTSTMISRFNGMQSRAVFLMNRVMFPHLATATLGGSSAANPVYLNGGTIANAPFGTIWGIPVIFTEYQAVEGTVGDILLADLGWYAFISKGAPSFAQSMHVRFLYDEMAFRVTFRCNGTPIPVSAVTQKDGSTTLSPFVVLNTRT